MPGETSTTRKLPAGVTAPVWNFSPVQSLCELDALDHDAVVEGYTETRRGDPQPGLNRGKSYWHGWRCRMIDFGEIKNDTAHQALVREYVARERRNRMLEAAAAQNNVQPDGPSS